VEVFLESGDAKGGAEGGAEGGDAKFSVSLPKIA
jgi:hypothetical protein